MAWNDNDETSGGVVPVSDYLKKLGAQPGSMDSASVGGTTSNGWGTLPQGSGVVTSPDNSGINAFGNANIQSPEHPWVTAGREAYNNAFGSKSGGGQSALSQMANVSVPPPDDTTPSVAAPLMPEGVASPSVAAAPPSAPAPQWHGIAGNLIDLLHKFSTPANGDTGYSPLPVNRPGEASALAPLPLNNPDEASSLQKLQLAAGQPQQQAGQAGITDGYSLNPNPQSPGYFPAPGRGSVDYTTPVSPAPATPAAGLNVTPIAPQPADTAPLSRDEVTMYSDPALRQAYQDSITSLKKVNPTMADSLQSEFDKRLKVYGQQKGREIDAGIPAAAAAKKAEAEKAAIDDTNNAANAQATQPNVPTIQDLLDKINNMNPSNGKTGGDVGKYIQDMVNSAYPNPWPKGTGNWEAVESRRLAAMRDTFKQAGHGMGYKMGGLGDESSQQANVNQMKMALLHGQIAQSNVVPMTKPSSAPAEDQAYSRYVQSSINNGVAPKSRADWKAMTPGAPKKGDRTTSPQTGKLLEFDGQKWKEVGADGK